MAARVAVVGAGFWGCAIARRLGERATVYDGDPSRAASRAAAGICKTGWYKQATVRRMMDGVFTYAEFADGFEWLRREVPLRHVPEVFVNRSRGTTRTHDDNWLGDPGDLLNTRSDALDVHGITPGERPRLLLSDGSARVFDAVVVAAGADTDTVLGYGGIAPVGVRPLPGSAILFDTATEAECMTVMVRPYVHFTFRRLGGRMRLGDTVGGRTDVGYLGALAAAFCPDIAEVEVVSGVRPVCDRMVIDWVAPGVIAATGGHRVGYGLAGAVARRVEDLLEVGT